MLLLTTMLPPRGTGDPFLDPRATHSTQAISAAMSASVISGCRLGRCRCRISSSRSAAAVAIPAFLYGQPAARSSHTIPPVFERLAKQYERRVLPLGGECGGERNPGKTLRFADKVEWLHLPQHDGEAQVAGAGGDLRLFLEDDVHSRHRDRRAHTHPPARGGVPQSACETAARASQAPATAYSGAPAIRAQKQREGEPLRRRR